MEGTRGRRLFWLGSVFVVGVGLHLLDHLRRHLPLFVTMTAAPFLILGPLALFGVWKGRCWGATLMTAVSVGGLVFGVWEHLVSSGPDHLSRLPWPSALLTLSSLGAAVPLAWNSLCVLGRRHQGA